MGECTATAYLNHSVLAGVVSAVFSLLLRIVLRRSWSLNPDILEAAVIGLIEGAVVTLLFCLHRGGLS
jgi:uncharacterized membrane protein